MEKVTAGKEQLGDFAPQFAAFNDDILFGKVWAREKELAARDRSIVTVTALIAGANFEQLPFHLQKAKDNGVTKEEMVRL
ncbi:4-carboxymuconolactone decarboxylase [Enterococcus sp. 665A]|uniref:4-carboxymuconolactone decarboxylase n=1 Tax=Candidatus Enterococcus ferrettii TaxID=2815324 RepID=A0ABV0EPG6_9ENTE